MTGTRRRSPPICRHLCVYAVALASAGCALSAGFTGGRVFGHDPSWQEGTGGSARLYPLGHQGLVVGLDQTWYTHWTQTGCCTEHRTTFFAGYGWLTRRDAPPVGLEGGGILSFGRGPWHGEPFPWMGLGVQVALPIRISSHREIWDDDGVADTAWALVPSVQLTRQWFYGLDADRIRYELIGGFAVRAQLDSALWP
jgi:hypothetical protein